MWRGILLKERRVSEMPCGRRRTKVAKYTFRGVGATIFIRRQKLSHLLPETLDWERSP